MLKTRGSYNITLALFLVGFIVFGCFAGAYHQFPHVFLVLVELSIACLVLMFTVVVLENHLEYRRTEEYDRRWEPIRGTTSAVLDRVSLEVKRGEVAAIIGPPCAAPFLIAILAKKRGDGRNRKSMW
jgi:hypothetical protein